MYEVYYNALTDKGSVSIGQFPRLYHALTGKITADLSTTDNNHRYQLFHLNCRVYRAAHKHNIKGVPNDLRQFAFHTAPAALSRQTDNYASIVGTLADTLRDVASHRDGLEFLIERIENEPSWLRWLWVS